MQKIAIHLVKNPSLDYIMPLFVRMNMKSRSENKDILPMKMQKLKLRIDWGDMDLLGHVNNVSIVRYLQSGRVMFMEKIGMPAYAGMKTGPIEAATEIQFCKQLIFPGSVEVCTGVREVKNTSIVLEHRLYDDGGELAVSAMEVIVFFDFVRQCKIHLTDELRCNIADYCAVLDDVV